MNIDYHRLIGKMIEAIEANQVLPWRKPWSAVDWPMNPLTGRRYTGGNAIYMMALALFFPEYRDPLYMGMKQVREWATKRGRVDEDGNPTVRVAKGATATWIKMVQPYIPRGEREAAAEEGRPPRERVHVKVVPVFNISMMEDTATGQRLTLADFVNTGDAELMKNDATHASVAEQIKGWNVPEVLHGGDRAAYSITHHRIVMPLPESFGQWDKYYATLFHEFGHSTGKALGREMTGDHYSPKYWREELVAELTSVHLLRTCGIELADHLFDNSTAYVKHYVELLKEDPKLLYDVAADAEKAAAHVIGQNIRAIEETAVEGQMEAA